MGEPLVCVYGNKRKQKVPQSAANFRNRRKALQLRNNAELYGTMRKQSPGTKSSPPSGGRRNHSRFAPLYEEICRLRARRLTWQEIADKLGAREGVKLNRTALWKMWDHRQRGTVRREYFPPPSVAEKEPESVSDPPTTAAIPASPSAELSEDELLGIAPSSPPKVVLKVRQGSRVSVPGEVKQGQAPDGLK